MFPVRTLPIFNASSRFVALESHNRHLPHRASDRRKMTRAFLHGPRILRLYNFQFAYLHTPGGIEASARSFRGLIDLAVAHGGSYYLTYHKLAKPEQVMACYPQFKQFLELKRKYDPSERFQSDWYRYYRKLFAS